MSGVPSADREAVLVLEDDRAIRQAMLRILERAGYAALGAANPEEALEIAARADLPLRLLITDFSFHTITGHDVAERLRRDRPELPVLYISGHEEWQVLPEERRRAGEGFLQKPFSMNVLVTRVRDLLQ